MTTAGESELTETIERLRAQVAALEADVQRLQGWRIQHEAHGWDDEPVDLPEPPVHAWLTGLQPRVRARPSLPRLPLEALFLAACAAAAAVAELEPLVIAAVMAGAWALVSLAEWSAARADRRRRVELLMPRGEPAEEAPARADPAWLTPPVERTAVPLEPPENAAATVSRLPPRSDEPLEPTMESRPG
jgi:hypothetical protein